jgi:hypothetical protein
MDRQLSDQNKKNKEQKMIYKSIKHYTKQLKTERPRVNPGAPVVEAIKTMFYKTPYKTAKD